MLMGTKGQVIDLPVLLSLRPYLQLEKQKTDEINLLMSVRASWTRVVFVPVDLLLSFLDI